MNTHEILNNLDIKSTYNGLVTIQEAAYVADMLMRKHNFNHACYFPKDIRETWVRLQFS